MNEWAGLQAEFKARKLRAAERLTVTTSMFAEEWQNRVGSAATSDQRIMDGLLLFGDAVLDEVPLRHVALVSVAGRVKVLTPDIGDRDEFIKWKDAVLSIAIQQQWGAAA